MWAGVLAALLLVPGGFLLFGRTVGESQTSETGAAAAQESEPETISDEIVFDAEGLRLADLGIETVKVAPSDRHLAVNGIVEPNLGSVARVTPLTEGKVVSVGANVGDSVARGQVLARVSSLALAEAQAELHHLSHRVTLQHKTLDRQRQLARLGEFGAPRFDEARQRDAAAAGERDTADKAVAAAKSDVEEARREQATLEGEVAEARADVAAARADLAEAETQVRTAQVQQTQTETRSRVAKGRFDRAELLLKEELISRQDWEQQQAEWQQAQAEVEAAQAGVSRSRARVESVRGKIAALESRVAVAQRKVAQAASRVESASARVSQADAKLGAARKSAEIAGQGLEREERVYRGSYLTSKEIVAAEHAMQEVIDELRAAEEKVRLLGGTPEGGNVVAVRAPFGGRITERAVSLGEMVSPEKALFTVMNLASVWVQLNVHQRDLPSVRVGQRVTVSTDTAPGRTFTGAVSHIGDVVDGATRTVKVRCDISAAGGKLKPAAFVRGVLASGGGSSVVCVPKDALQEMGGRWVAYIPVPGRSGAFRVQPVEPGTRSEAEVEIRSGLKAGDRVVVRNAFVVKAQAMKAELAEE